MVKVLVTCCCIAQLPEISWLIQNSVVLMLESWTVGVLGGGRGACVGRPGMFDVMHLGYVKGIAAFSRIESTVPNLKLFIFEDSMNGD